MEARVGEHNDAAEYAVVNRIPSRANESRFGDSWKVEP
jgi:hypothetical protein